MRRLCVSPSQQPADAARCDLQRAQQPLTVTFEGRPPQRRSRRRRRHPTLHDRHGQRTRPERHLLARRRDHRRGGCDSAARAARRVVVIVYGVILVNRASARSLDVRRGSARSTLPTPVQCIGSRRAHRADDRHRVPPLHPMQVEDLVAVADGEVHRGQRRRVHVVQERLGHLAQPPCTGASRPASHTSRPMT